MRDCVSVSDEALALQVLYLRGDEYVRTKNKKKVVTNENEKTASEVPKGKGGRKKRTLPRGEQPDYETTLCETVNMYIDYHHKVRAARMADPEDDLGWNEYLKNTAIANTLSGASKSGKKKIIEIVDIPVDDVRYITAKRSQKADVGKVTKKAKV